MLIFLQELVLQLFLWLLQFIDGMMEISSAISGITRVKYHGTEVNLIELVVGDSTVGAVFWCVFILAVGLACIFAIVGLIKNMVANNRTISNVMGKFFLSLLGTMAILVVVVLGILIANSVLQMIAKIFQVSNTAKLSTSLFDACVGDWINGYSKAEFDVSSISVRDILGDYNTALWVWPTSWKGNGMVNPNTFLYFPALVASIALGIALLVAIINLAKRVFEIVFLYLVMPLSMSTLAADDGARFKIWRETFITKIVLAYGAVFSINIFVLILPMLSQMRIDGISDFGNAMFLIFMMSAYYGSRFASLAVFGLAGGLLRMGYKGTRGVVRKIRAKKTSDNGDNDSGGTSDGGDRYTETSSTPTESGTETGTDTGGSGESS